MEKVFCLCGWWLMRVRKDKDTDIEHKCQKCKRIVSIEVRKGSITVMYREKSA